MSNSVHDWGEIIMLLAIVGASLRLPVGSEQGNKNGPHDAARGEVLIV